MPDKERLNSIEAESMTPSPKNPSNKASTRDPVSPSAVSLASSIHPYDKPITKSSQGYDGAKSGKRSLVALDLQGHHGQAESDLSNRLEIHERRYSAVGIRSLSGRSIGGASQFERQTDVGVFRAGGEDGHEPARDASRAQHIGGNGRVGCHVCGEGKSLMTRVAVKIFF